jgi:hemolysin type calcium-binding protein
MTTFTVDAGGTGDFSTIQAAIDAASDGDIIEVSADTYDEDLLINKAVTILGAQAGVNGTAGRDAVGGIGETTIIGRSEITASGAVTIDGVRFLDDASTTGGGLGNPILKVASGQEHVITNSIFYSEVNGAANGVLDTAILLNVLTTGTVEISKNYFTGAFAGAFSDGSWGRGIWFNGGGIDATIGGNTFEFTRTGINLDMSGDSAATVVGNTFITNGTGTSVAFDLDNVSFADNNFEDTNEEFNFSNLTTNINFDAEVAVATVTPVNPVVDAVVVLGGTGNDTIRGTAGSDFLDGNASGNPVADNNTLEGRGGDDLLQGGGGDDVLDGGPGNDTIIGGPGDDTYIFRPGSGADRFSGFIAGLNTDDHVDIRAFTGITSFAQVLSLATQVDQNTVIDFGGGDVITLANVLKDSLAEEDFVLANPNPPPGVTANMVLRQSGNGQYEIYNLGNNSILAAHLLGQVGTDWGFVTLGGFNDGDSSDMLLRNSTSGAFQVYDIAPNSNNITGSALLGAVGLEWQVLAFGNFDNLGNTDMILRNVTTADLRVYNIANNQFTGSAVMGAVGVDWQFSGVGNFSGRGTSDLLLRNSDTGDLRVYNITNNQITGSAVIAAVGVNWQFSGIGNFGGVPGESDLLLRDSITGKLQVYDINNNQITGTATIAFPVGSDWQFAGIAPVSAPGASDLVLRNINSGDFQVYNIANNQLTGSASLGGVGLDWQLPQPPSGLLGGGFAASSPTAAAGSLDGSTSQLVQAMAGFGGGAADTSPTAPLSADTSQQQFLTTPQHA